MYKRECQGIWHSLFDALMSKKTIFIKLFVHIEIIV